MKPFSVLFGRSSKIKPPLEAVEQNALVTSKYSDNYKC